MSGKLNRLMSSTRHARHRAAPPPSTKPFTVLDKTRKLEPAPSAHQWIVVMVAPRRELDAVASLREAGYLAWHPQMVLWISSARLRVKSKVNRPLFPRYVLVAQQAGCTKPIGACDHVTYIVGLVPLPSKDRDGRLRKSMVETLSDRQQAMEFDGTIEPPRVAVGDLARIEDGGPFEGLAGIVSKSEGERTLILLNILGSQTKVYVDAASLARVA